jgi:hypothetical protein
MTETIEAKLVDLRRHIPKSQVERLIVRQTYT